ncbi:MAG: hypothetical protein ABIV51_05920 [Saprospiraceae bacterium]
MSNKEIEKFHSFYSDHKCMLYGIIHEITRSREERNELFTSTFVEAYRLKLPALEYPSSKISLIRLLVKIVCGNHKQNEQDRDRHKQLFASSPFLRNLIEVEMRDYEMYTGCDFARTQAHRDLRDDFILLRKMRTAKCA